MAENFISRFINKRLDRAVAKSNSRNYRLTDRDTTGFFPLPGALGYLFGKNKGYSSFRKFLDSYGENPLVSMIVKKISATSASIGYEVVNSNGDIVENSELEEFLKSPNSEQSYQEFKQMINEYLLLTGNAYIRFVEGIGMGEEVVILDTSRTEIICNAFGQIKQYKYTNPNGDVDPIDPSEILHIKSSNVVNTESEEVKYGLSPLQAGWVIVQSSSEKFNAEASIFKNRGVIGFASNDTDIPMQSTEQEEMQNLFNSQTGGSDKFNGIHVTNTRLRFVQTGMSPTDLKLLEGITSSLRQLCAIYGMPSVLFNDVEKSTFNNYETAVKVAYTDVYIPLENKVNRDLSQWLSEKLGVDEEIKVDLNSIEAIKLTTNEVAQALKSLDTKAQERVLENMSQEEIRSLVRLADLPDGVSVIGASATNTNDEGSS